VLALGIALAAAPAGAADPPPDAQHALARDLFRRGFALLNAGDLEHALDFFLRSRAAEPSGPNTRNAAHCLDRLERHDEALEMYEELLVSFPEDLGAQDRAIIGPAMAALRRKVGGIEVSADVQGLVVVDGRARGRLPRTSPVRVLGGAHVVRILKDGYAPFEAAVHVNVGAVARVDARMRPLAGVGLLRVEDPADEGSSVFVDGVRVGTSPWEGMLGPGRHLVWTQRGDRGSAPEPITVLAGQTALARAASGALGPALRIEVEPPTADIALDGVTLAKGSWEGRLPAGEHLIAASEEGYRPASRSLGVQAAKAAPPELVVLRLAVDPAHPRWPRSPVGRLSLTAFAGYLAAGTLHADAEGGAPPREPSGPSPCGAAISSQDAVGGYVVGLRAGYRFRRGPVPELTGGYMSFGTAISREERCSYRIRTTGQVFPVRYRIQDDLRTRGGFAALGASHRAAIGSHAGLVTRGAVGILFARSSDPIAATASTGGASVPAVVSGGSAVVASPLPFVMPEIGAEIGWRGFQLGLSLGAAFFPLPGPAFEHATIGVASKAGCDAAAEVSCSPNARAVAAERSSGPFVLWMPRIGVGYTF
jgi:hypothetical protein